MEEVGELVQTLKIPTPDQVIARPNTVLLQPKNDWTWDAPDMVANLADDIKLPDLATNRRLIVHATYAATLNRQYVFGFHHLHALIGEDGEFNCQEIENYSGRLMHHVSNLPPSRYIIPDIRREAGGFTIDYRRIAREPPIDLPGYSFFASPIEPENWGMWVLNAILSATAYVAGGQAGRFLCYASYPWQVDLLRFLGVLPEKLMLQKPWTTYRCARIGLHQYTRVDLIPDLFSGAAFCNIIARCTRTDGPAAERIFVSRRTISKKLGGAYRCLLNEEALADALRGHGYLVVEPELLTFQQQVRLFNAARVVVGLGGAAMFNTVFCEPGTKVISIESTGAFALNHARLFASCGHRYGFIFGQQNAAEGRYPHNNWTIDVPRAVQAVLSFA